MEASIIVPFTRPVLGKRTINSLLNQKTSHSFEIILVGKKENMVKISSKKIKKAFCDFSLLPGQARNFGVKEALGKYLLFIDDDCLATKNWLEKNLSILKKTEKIGAVGGRIIGFSRKYFSRCTDYTNFWRQQGDHLRKTTQLYTASLAVKKEAFEKVGGFDEKVKVGEDADFVNRLSQSGYFSFFNPKIVVFHDHQRDTLNKYLNYMFNNGLDTGLYVLKNYRQIKSFFPILKKTYFIFIIPTAFLYTGASLFLNLRSNWKIVIYLPFIFLGYLVYNSGIAVRLIKDF